MVLTRRDVLKGLGVGALMAAGARRTAADPARRPNIVLIMADDLGYECVGAYGSTLKTPHLDGAAARGMRFSHCYAQPLCTPSRVQIMTGKYNHRNYEAFGYLNPAETTFANVLKSAGYATCIAGKWQLSGDAGTVRHFGFDEHCLWNMHPYKEAKGSPSANEPPEWRERYRNPTLYRNGEWIRPGADAYGPDVCCDFLLSFMERHRNRPFCVYYPMVLTHSPFVPTPDSPDWDRPRKGKEAKQRHFAEMVAYTDKLVGRIEAKLSELGLMENTVVLFTGDNGTHGSIRTPMKDGSEIKGGKGKTKDAGTRVPLIVWGKGVRRGAQADALVDFTDIMPTLLDIAGVPRPGTVQWDGHSLKPVLAGERESTRDVVFCYYEPRWGKKSRRQVFARDRDYKVYDDGRFYHITADVLEKSDLSKGRLSPEQAAARDRLSACLRRILESGPGAAPVRK